MRSLRVIGHNESNSRHHLLQKLPVGADVETDAFQLREHEDHAGLVVRLIR